MKLQIEAKRLLFRLYMNPECWVYSYEVHWLAELCKQGLFDEVGITLRGLKEVQAIREELNASE